MAKGNKFQARLESQKAQLERNGYSAEVVVRTTPEATDMINFARLWEHILVTADRRTRGYMSASKREDYEKTQKAFLDSVDYMMKQMKAEIDRHDMDLSTNNFISRVAQRYKLAEPGGGKANKPKPTKQVEEKRAAKAEKAEKADKAEKPASKKDTTVVDQVEGL